MRRANLGFVCIVAVMIAHHVQYSEASWFDDLFKGLTGAASGATSSQTGVQKAEAAHDAVYGDSGTSAANAVSGTGSSWYKELFNGLKNRFGTSSQSGGVQSSGDSGTQTQFQVPTTDANKGSRMRELIAAAAGFEAMRTYERQQASKTGEPVNHNVMKGVLAGLAAAAVDHLVETKGLDYIDRMKARTEAQSAAENLVQEKYGMNSLVDDTTNGGPSRTVTQAGEYR